MIQMKYHTTINSFYIQIFKVRYQTSMYIKCHIKYFSKASNLLLAEEKNVKLMKDKIKHWEVWND